MGLWLLFAIPGAILTTLTGWAAFGKGKNARAVRRHAKRARHKLWAGTKTRYSATRRYYRAKRDATPRGQLRLKRKAQPHRWTFGHVRTADDPTRSRRAARVVGTHAKRAGTGVLTNARNRYRTRRANARPKPRRILELGTGKMTATAGRPRGGSGLTCGAPTGRKHDGPPCQNTPMYLGGGKYAGACYIRSHRDWSAQNGEAMAKAQASVGGGRS